MKIAAIGASAGGIEAFRLFFENMPAGSGVGFVVVLHMSAQRKSLLPEIIGRWSPMPVVEAEDGQAVRPDHVHVIPSGHAASLTQGVLRLRQLAGRETAPIDRFFDSLAQDQGADTIGIVLSGTGHDGALGLKAIKARGGLTMAQSAGSENPDAGAPAYPGMPDSAIATGAVDIMVPVHEMPARICGFLALEAAGDLPLPDTVLDEARRRICDILQNRLGHDFSGYRDGTFLRRVERRMQARGIPKLDAYLKCLAEEREEAVLLFRDLLIGVTSFFRDPEVFEALRSQALPRLLSCKNASDQLRVWVPGCATGEEAYSLAMLLREATDGMASPPSIHVFATDIDETAIATARMGRYPASLLEGVPAARRARFFQEHDHSYTVTKDLRELCTFSAHNLIRDPPFSRMHLVSCRNLLIYMDSELQATVIPRFHFSLVPNGILMLGRAESLGRHEPLFHALDSRLRLHQRRDVRTPALSLSARTSLPPAMGGLPEGANLRARNEAATGWPRAVAQANARVLERFAAPFVIVNEDGVVMHYSSHVGRFLTPPLGPPSQSLFDMVRPALRHALRVVLRDAVERAGHSERKLTLDEAPLPGGEGAQEARRPRTIRVIAEPLAGEEGSPFYLIVLAEQPAEAPASHPPRHDRDSATAELERELREARRGLQQLAEEHEAALAELRCANEELHSVNEELRCTNEEMATSKEEIQSVSEEMHTVNAQLAEKVEELDHAHSDLRNLFESTRVPTVFLDRNLVIRSFTPDMAQVYHLIPSDRGRPLPDIVTRLDYATLREDVAQVLDSLSSLERRVTLSDGSAHFLMRILPYRSPTAEVEGTLITFVDVTGIVRAEYQQRILVDELNHRVKNMLGVVAALARQTARRSASLAEFSEAFQGRMGALTAAYSLVSRNRWEQTDLRELLALKLQAFAAVQGGQVRLEGPPVALGPNAALAMGLAIHELATNAAKYGALSTPEGRVHVTWNSEAGAEEDSLHMEWTEEGGPPVTPPRAAGFGTQLIERSLVHSLRGEARLDFRSEGLKATLRAVLPREIRGAPLESAA